MHHDCSHDCMLNSRFTFGPYLFYTEKFVTQFKTTEKNDRSLCPLEIK